jgi:hypothetical protein
MAQEYFGTEVVTEQDLTYVGSRFPEVLDARFANPYQNVCGRDCQPALPTYEVALPSLLRGILSLRKQYLFVRPLNAPSILIRICVGARTVRDFGDCFIRAVCVSPDSGKSGRKQNILSLAEPGAAAASDHLYGTTLSRRAGVLPDLLPWKRSRTCLSQPACEW